MAQPIKSLLKGWDYSVSFAAWFVSALSLPWALKPLYGLLTDFVPLAGSRRRSYLVLTTGLASVSLLAASILPLGSDAAMLLLLLLLPAAIAIGFSDVVVDALMIETGRPLNITGLIQSVQWGSIFAAMLVAGALGGVLTQWGVHWLAFFLSGLVCSASFLAVWRLVREPSLTNAHVGEPRSGACTPAEDACGPVRTEMMLTLRQPDILAVGMFLALWNFNPFSSTVLYYYSTQTLHFDEQFVGLLASLWAAGAIAGCILYGLVFRALPATRLIHLAIATGILATLSYWGYRDAMTGILVSAVAGMATAIAYLVLLDLAARACRPRTAGTTFALLMSLTNVSALAAQGAGGVLYDVMAREWGAALAFQLLVASGALTTAGCWFLLPVLKRRLPAAMRP
jgi:MFS family permease